MDLGFGKKVEILPGVKVNYNKKGISGVSVGKKKSKLNLDVKKIKKSLGIDKNPLSLDFKKKK